MLGYGNFSALAQSQERFAGAGELAARWNATMREVAQSLPSAEFGSVVRLDWSNMIYDQNKNVHSIEVPITGRRNGLRGRREVTGHAFIREGVKGGAALVYIWNGKPELHAAAFSGPAVPEDIKKQLMKMIERKREATPQ